MLQESVCLVCQKLLVSICLCIKIEGRYFRFGTWTFSRGRAKHILQRKFSKTCAFLYLPFIGMNVDGLFKKLNA